MKRRGAGLRRFFVALAFIFVCAGWTAQAQNAWSYEGEITGKGTRSEGFVGRLFFDGKRIPAKLEAIKTPIGEYKYAPGGAPWSRSGWLRSAPLKASVQSDLRYDANSKDEARWYKGGWRQGTPRSWVYLPTRAYWLAPDAVEEFAVTVLKDEPAPSGSLREQLLGEESAQGDPNPRSAVFLYKEWTSAPGSKSAGSRGELLYNGRPIHGHGVLKTPIGSFAFANGQYAWNAQGWFLTDDVVVADSGYAITVEEREKGSYAGPKKASTPSDWCYSTDDQSWYAPQRLL